nr:immunoglobulin heavy chain junction region [Macaca mulatta]MOY18976.1 immunoglobulin heavy chain junction region [Macaca mulatta]MOY19056.1 immunoglobulin heavy chain junction region [Macaca mulatta]MOY20162.1 immunoglobulin heavy chain junction region [Macaca mulatta]MOY20723.1 immunoglobulin heavy chain junction region [Macaca mulatta]
CARGGEGTALPEYYYGLDSW